jgi:hypothetical protein
MKLAKLLGTLLFTIGIATLGQAQCTGGGFWVASSAPSPGDVATATHTPASGCTSFILGYGADLITGFTPGSAVVRVKFCSDAMCNSAQIITRRLRAFTNANDRVDGTIPSLTTPAGTGAAAVEIGFDIAVSDALESVTVYGLDQ